MYYINDQFKSISPEELEIDRNKNFFTKSNKFLLQNKDFLNDGFLSIDILTNNNIEALLSHIEKKILSDLLAFQPDILDFKLSNYHAVVLNDHIHKSISKWGIPIEDMDEFYFIVKNQVENFMGIELTTKEIEHNSKKGRYVGYRLVRPQRQDYNPFHRDSWIDYWQDTINIWLPLSGFNNENGLQLIEQSHVFNNENIYRTKSGYINGDKTYHVPATIAINHPFKILKPTLRKGQGLLFSPFLIHGNGVNNSTNETRVSLEFRFSKKQI